MNGEYESKAAMQMAQQSIDATSRIVAALIEALMDRCRRPEDKAILDHFRSYVADGGKLMTVTVSADNQKAFEEVIKSAGIMTYKTTTAYKPGMGVYVYEDTAQPHMDDAVLELHNQGIDLVPSRRIEYAALSESCEGVMSTISLTEEQAARLRLKLDTYCIDYAVTQYPDHTEIAVSKQDYERVKDMPDMQTYMMEPINAKNTIRDVRRIVSEAAREASRDTENKRERKSGLGLGKGTGRAGAGKE